MTREELNQSINIINQCPNVAIQACTGAGKSKCALDMATKVKAKRILLFIAERAHYKNWEDEINKWGFKSPIHISCYNSMHKFIDTNWDIIIYDEAHHLQSDLRVEYFSHINSKYKVFLSATLKDRLINRLQFICGHIETIKVGLQDAFNSKLLPEPKIVLVPLTLNNKDNNRTITEEWGKKEKRVTIECLYKDRWKYLRAKKQIPNATLLIRCTEQQEYDYYTEKQEYLKKRYYSTRNQAIHNLWMQAGSKRKLLLGSYKTDVAKKVIDLISDRRFICFCTNISQADYLGKNNAIHSKKSDKQKLELIEGFNNLKINSLFAVGMLQEGMNLNNIESTITNEHEKTVYEYIKKRKKVTRSELYEKFIDLDLPLIIINLQAENYIDSLPGEEYVVR